MLPPPTVASLVLLFVSYVAADGAFAIFASVRGARRGARWRMLLLEGVTNLALAGVVLVWPLIAVAPLFVHLASAWAVVTGSLTLAAARRLSGPHGRWLLVLAGAVSAAWGASIAAAGPPSTDGSRVMGRWLAVYALLFGGVLLLLVLRLRRHPLPSTASDRYRHAQ